MTHEQFDALVDLIDDLITQRLQSNEHPADAPRMRKAREERDTAVSEARAILVTEDDEPDI